MGHARVRAAFERARDEGRAALVVYLPAGYPDLDISVECLVAAADAGADVIEVGFPFSDPMMDGPTIQRANQVALERGYRVDDDFDVARRVVDRVAAPALTMTYVTIPDVRGYGRFADDAAAAGLDGAILPDLPADGAEPWLAEAARHELATVFLASAVSTEERLAGIAAASSGFVYAAGLLGVTGVETVALDDSRRLVERLRAHTDTPVAVGIGVRDRESAAAVAAFADGVIVGSAVVRAAGEGEPGEAPARVRALVAELRAGVAAR